MAYDLLQVGDGRQWCGNRLAAGDLIEVGIFDLERHRLGAGAIGLAISPLILDQRLKAIPRISLVEPKDVGIVLAFSQTLVGRMSQFAVSRPGPKLDLGDQGRLDPDNVSTSGIGQGRLLPLPAQLVEHLPQPNGLCFLKTRPYTSDVDEIGSAIGAEHQQAETSGKHRRHLITDNEEGLALHAFDFPPISGSA